MAQIHRTGDVGEVSGTNPLVFGYARTRWFLYALLSWSLASALDLINDSEVAGEFPHVVLVAFMRGRRKKVTR